MKKYLLFVLASLFGACALFASPAWASCTPKHAGAFCSVQNYKEQACAPWKDMTRMGFENAAMKKAAPPVKELAEYFIENWRGNLKRVGKVPILSEPEKKHVYHLMRGIYAGKWESPDEVYVRCMNEGNAFPEFLREELAEAKRHFLLQTTASQ